MGDENPNWELILHRLDEMKASQQQLSDKVDSICEKLAIVDSIKDSIHDFKEWKDEFQKEISVKQLVEIKEWKANIDEIMSPTQMKEVKDEVYRQKNKWTAAIAIIAAIQILMGIVVALDKLGVF